MKIIEANIAEQAKEIQCLFLQYYDELLGIDVCFQDFDDELINLEQIYRYPHGELLLAMNEQELMVCIALTKVEQNICEMKRLYVSPKYRGKGLGRMLTQAIIRKAIQTGYTSMRLDTLEWLKEAINLYKSLGFRKIPPYLHDTPVKLVYLQLDLENINFSKFKT
jgi:ribosomal protein S18 acetylase RimI-like enzyme